MICKCGGMMRESTYKTKDGIKHEVHTCRQTNPISGCGRRFTRYYDQNGNLIRFEK